MNYGLNDLAQAGNPNQHVQATLDSTRDLRRSTSEELNERQ